MLADLPRVSSARAAEIVEVGYEGFRSYLKRGLLGRVGMLPGFHRAGADTHDDPAPRSKWMMFGFADLCLMRTAKLLMDRGFTFESANGVVSQHEIWSYMQHDEQPIERYLLIWPPYGDHIVFGTDELHHLPERVRERQAQGVFTLLNLAEIQQHVAAQLRTSADLPGTQKPDDDRQADRNASPPKSMISFDRLRATPDQDEHSGSAAALRV